MEEGLGNQSINARRGEAGSIVEGFVLPQGKQDPAMRWLKEGGAGFTKWGGEG